MEIKITDEKIKFEKDGTIIVKEENKSLNDLRQKLINYLYNLPSYDNNDIELIKILFNEDKFI